MFRRTTSIVALFAFTNYILGCYITELISPNVFALTNGTIRQLVLKDGSFVKFDNARGGGKYSSTEAILTVRNFSGDSSPVPLSKIAYVSTAKA